MNKKLTDFLIFVQILSTILTYVVILIQTKKS